MEEKDVERIQGHCLYSFVCAQRKSVYVYCSVFLFHFSQLQEIRLLKEHKFQYTTKIQSVQRGSVSMLNESIVDENSGFQLWTLALVNMHFISALNVCCHVYVNKKSCASRHCVNLAHS